MFSKDNWTIKRLFLNNFFKVQRSHKHVIFKELVLRTFEAKKSSFLKEFVRGLSEPQMQIFYNFFKDNWTIKCLFLNNFFKIHRSHRHGTFKELVLRTFLTKNLSFLKAFVQGLSGP